jgi:hypothetical protein
MINMIRKVSRRKRARPEKPLKAAIRSNPFAWLVVLCAVPFSISVYDMLGAVLFGNRKPTAVETAIFVYLLGATVAAELLRAAYEYFLDWRLSHKVFVLRKGKIIPAVRILTVRPVP